MATQRSTGAVAWASCGVAVLGLALVMALGAGGGVAKAASSSKSGDASPVMIHVAKSRTKTGIRYDYTVVNRAPHPLSSLRIGYDGTVDAPELAVAPVGYDGANVPPSSTTAPPGWEFMAVRTEEDSLLWLEWSATESQLPNGVTLGGFSVTVPKEDGAYDHGHWIAIMDMGRAKYADALNRGRAPAAPGLEDVRITVSKTTVGVRRSIATIAFDMPVGGLTTVEIHDAKGRKVWELSRAYFAKGPQSVVWGGQDSAGRTVPPGKYRVRIVADGFERAAPIAFKD